jgi:hypothetical protein
MLSHLIAYLVGGLTLLPLVVCIILAHAYFTLPEHNSPNTDAIHTTELDLSEHEKDAANKELAALPQDLKVRSHDPDVAAGYFAVNREYDEKFMVGKPMEKGASMAPASSVTESPSVYQTMYRSIFERGKTQNPSINGTAKGSRKTSNIFFIIIR